MVSPASRFTAGDEPETQLVPQAAGLPMVFGFVSLLDGSGLFLWHPFDLECAVFKELQVSGIWVGFIGLNLGRIGEETAAVRAPLWEEARRSSIAWSLLPAEAA